MRRFRDQAFDWTVWALFAAVPAVIFWQSATSLEEQGAASGGAMENAAFYPRIVAAIMTALLAWHVVRLALARSRKASPFARGVGTRLALVAAGMFVGYLLALPYAGYHLATPILSALLFRILGMRPLPAVAGGLVLSFGLAFVFESLLNVILPVGIFDLALFS